MRAHCFATTLLLASLSRAVAAQGETLTITIAEENCTRLVEHVPAGDLAYRAGVDVDGAPVVPADLDGAPAIAPPREIEIPIQLDLQAKIGVPANPDLFQTRDTTVGIAVWREGRVWYNGVPLENEETARIAALCRETLEKARAEEKRKGR